MQNLLEYAALKLLSQRIGVAQIERRREAVSIRFTEKAAVDPERLARFVAEEPGSQFTPAGVLKFSLKEKQPEQVLVRLKSLLEQLAGEQQAWHRLSRDTVLVSLRSSLIAGKRIHETSKFARQSFPRPDWARAFCRPPRRSPRK